MPCELWSGICSLFTLLSKNKPYINMAFNMGFFMIEKDNEGSVPSDFEWDEEKNAINQLKHGVSFSLAQLAFADPRRLITEDFVHSGNEKRFYCLGYVDGEILTVRFTYRNARIRIIGAGYWRKGKSIYEKENKVH